MIHANERRRRTALFVLTFLLAVAIATGLWLPAAIVCLFMCLAINGSDERF